MLLLRHRVVRHGLCDHVIEVNRYKEGNPRSDKSYGRSWRRNE